MGKPHKFDLKSMIATDVAPMVRDEPLAQPPLPEEAPVAAPDVEAVAPAAVELAPVRSAPASAPVARRGTLKQRAKQQSLYLEPEVYEALREIAFHERVHMHDLFLEGIDAVLKKRGSRSIKQLIAGKPQLKSVP